MIFFLFNKKKIYSRKSVNLFNINKINVVATRKKNSYEFINIIVFVIFNFKSLNNSYYLFLYIIEFFYFYFFIFKF